MSPKSSLNGKPARPERNERENSERSADSRGERNHANVPSVSQAGDSTIVSPQKRPASPDDTDAERERKRLKNELSASAAPHPPLDPSTKKPDPSPRKPLPQSSTLKSGTGPLEAQIQTWQKLPLHDSDNGRVQNVEQGKYLDDEQVTLAIAAVTEVVNQFYNPDMYLWSLLSTTTLAAAQQYPPWDRTDYPRLIRSKLVFPMFWTPKKLLCYPDVVTDDGEIQYVQKSVEEHIFLVKVLFNRGQSRLPQLVIMDSSPAWLDRSSEEWQMVVSEMRRTVTNLGIWDPPASQVNNFPSLETYQMAFEPEMHLPVARQQNRWACGVHAIMNAWADALLFKIDPACHMDPDSDSKLYKQAVDVINLVLDGRATLGLVADLLIHTGFVLHGLREQSPAVRELRIDSRVFREYHQITSNAMLDSRILAQKYEAMNRLKALIQENRPDSALALSVAQRTVLPRLRKKALEEKLKAAKRAAKTPSKTEPQEKKKLPAIDEATVSYFTAKVQHSPTAKAQMRKFCEDLKSRGIISDSGTAVFTGTDHNSKKASPRECKVDFLRLFGYHTRFTKTEVWWEKADPKLLQLYFRVWRDARRAEDPSEPVPASKPT